ncbi:signal peptidase I [Candidatus Peregrinibacteria bacterium]|nr:signal peptidase I [Candidatus Peregrinibacteria bacterium]
MNIPLQTMPTWAVVAYFAIILLMLASNWVIFTKAGKPGWASIIPIYNFFVLLDIVGKPAWWFLLMLIPLVNIVIAIIVLHRLSLSFGKGAGFTVGLILLNIIFFPILAFGGSKYVKLGTA